jgi:RNA polymerase sigma factor (sigma-70 family)
MQKKYSDEIVMKHLSQGDKNAAGILYDRYHQNVYGYFVKMTRNREISRDLTQNVFMRIIKYSHSWKEDKTFKYWLFRIARNILTDYYRDSKIFYASEDDRALQIADNDQSSKELELKESHEILIEAMSQLSPSYREVIELNRFQGFTYKEIAQTTASTESAVRVKAFRAIQKLKEIYTTIVIE